MADKKNEIAAQLNDVVGNVLTQTHLQGFERAFLTSSAIGQLKEMLTPEYMKPIMNLQGNKLGFLTDADRKGGYPEEVVKNALIEAVLMGLQPYGNQFNIISGNCYPTKEGLGYVLNHWQGLSYTIIPGVPEVRPDNKSAVVPMEIRWELNGKKENATIPISVKNDAYASVDSLIGKATRKARAWLLSNISGIEVVDADATEIPHTEVSSTVSQVAKNKQDNRVLSHIENAADIKTLAKCRKAIDDSDKDTMDIYIAKYISLCTTIKELELAKNQFTAEDHELVIAYDDKERELKNG
jgi:hypothetical protein